MKNNFGITKSLGAQVNGYGLREVAPQSSYGHWDATMYSKDRSTYFVGGSTDERKEMTAHDRNTLMKFSRYLARNNGAVKGAIDDMALYSVGAGMMPQAQSDDNSWNDEAEMRFREWSKQSDFEGLFNLSELLTKWSKAIDIDGDCFVLMTQDERGMPKLQTIKAHRIRGHDEEKKIFDGVKVDSKGRPVYYLLDDGTRVFTKDIIHIFDAHSFEGVRGVPSTAHAINNIFDVKEILALEKKGVKLNSAIATVIKSTAPMQTGGYLGQQSSTTTDGKVTTLEKIMGGGIIPRLDAGEDITSFNSSRPSPTFDGFIEHFLRDFAVGIGLPFEFIWDSAKVGGTAQRLILQKAQRRFEQRQRSLAKAMSRIWGWYIAKQIKDKRMPSNDLWYKVDWQMPKKITVDAGRDSKATIEELKMGLTTYKEDYASRGKDWQIELKQAAEEEKFMKELAAQYGIDPERLSQRTPNGNQNSNEESNESSE